MDNAHVDITEILKVRAILRNFVQKKMVGAIFLGNTFPRGLNLQTPRVMILKIGFWKIFCRGGPSPSQNVPLAVAGGGHFWAIFGPNPNNPNRRVEGRGGGRGVWKPSKPKVLTFTKTHLKFLGGWYINKKLVFSDILVKISYFDLFCILYAL